MREEELSPEEERPSRHAGSPGRRRLVMVGGLVTILALGLPSPGSRSAHAPAVHDGPFRVHRTPARRRVHHRFAGAASPGGGHRRRNACHRGRELVAVPRAPHRPTPWGWGPHVRGKRHSSGSGGDE